MQKANSFGKAFLDLLSRKRAASLVRSLSVAEHKVTPNRSSSVAVRKVTPNNPFRGCRVSRPSGAHSRCPAKALTEKRRFWAYLFASRRTKCSGKGFVFTGGAFFLSIALIISANYLMLAKKSQETSVSEKMKIDKVLYRYTDVKRILSAALNDGRNDGTSCAQDAKFIEAYLDTALGSALLDANGLTTTASVSVTNTCAAPSGKQIKVLVSFTIEDADKTVHKEGSYAGTFVY